MPPPAPRAAGVPAFSGLTRTCHHTALQHLDIYRARPAAKAILHAHPTYCTALAALHLEIPAFHYMVGAAGGKKIPCAKPATASCVCRKRAG